jgi:hypothetical protein
MKLYNVPYDLGTEKEKLQLSLGSEASESQALSAQRRLFELYVCYIYSILTTPPTGTGILRTRYEVYGSVPQISRLI